MRSSARTSNSGGGLLKLKHADADVLYLHVVDPSAAVAAVVSHAAALGVAEVFKCDGLDPGGRAPETLEAAGLRE